MRVNDGSIVITNDTSSDQSGTYLHDFDRFHPAKHWVDENHCIVGGILPPNATTVDVMDDRGSRVSATVAGGAYAALLDQPTDVHEPIVCFRNEAGVPIRRPRPSEYPSVPVTDADQPCPACGAIDYDEYSPLEEWRGGRGGPNGTVVPNPIVSCRVCGHDEPEPNFMRSGLQADVHETATEEATRIARVRAQILKQQWLSAKMTLSDTRFPIYAADGWPSQLGGSGSQGGRSTEITIKHFDTPLVDPFAGDQPRMTVTTTQGDPVWDDVFEARRTLDHWLRADGAGTPWPDASDAALTLWLRARDRDRRAVLLDADRTEQLIMIDGTPTPTLMLMSRGRWVAVARQQNLTIAVAAYDVDPAVLHLKPIADPLAQLLGLEPHDA